MVHDTNMFFGTGKIRQVQEGRTSQGEQCASFVLVMTHEEHTAWIRCNAYGMLAKKCIDRLNPDDTVSIRGKVMNRRDRKGLAFTEIRCKDVFLIQL